MMTNRIVMNNKSDKHIRAPYSPPSTTIKQSPVRKHVNNSPTARNKPNLLNNVLGAVSKTDSGKVHVHKT